MHAVRRNLGSTGRRLLKSAGIIVVLAGGAVVGWR
jgi:hypothetical protein